MAHFLRGKQAGIQNDFSAAVEPDFFMLDDVSFSIPKVLHYGPLVLFYVCCECFLKRCVPSDL